jgi:uncharacterized protein (TIGR03000 family)
LTPALSTAPPAPAAERTSESTSDAAVLEVRVPAAAAVYVNGVRTSSKGISRRFASNQLKPGESKEIQVCAVITRNGESVQQTKTTRVRAGTIRRLSFDFDYPTTSLILSVPSDATVELAGQSVSGTGSVRTFRTTRLASSEAVPDYTVLVRVVRDGRMLSQEQSITLQAGETRNLRFDFEP